MSDSAPIKRLYRSRSDKVIGGVSGGIGRYMGVDPVIIRIIFLASVFLGGSGLLAYLIAWILIPEEPAPEGHVLDDSKPDGGKIVGIVLIVIALIWLAGRFGINHMFIIPWGWVGPVALVALGIALMLRPSAQRAADEASVRKAESVPAENVDTESTESADPFSGAESRRQLRRSRYDRVLFGVCGGIATHLHTDSTLVRVLFALATIFSAGLVIIVYLFLGLVLPEEEAHE
jgi:phage shock protein PspC (stress-responsive transcriptional regulator)